MLSNIFSFFKLSWFCLRLSIDLTVFLFIFAIKKANQKKITEFLLIILIVSIWILNLYVIRQRNNVQINLEKTKITKGFDQEINLNQTILKADELKTKTENYQKIDDMKINSLGLYLNLATLNSALKNTKVSEDYFSKAQKIEPKIKYLEN